MKTRKLDWPIGITSGDQPANRTVIYEVGSNSYLRGGKGQLFTTWDRSVTVLGNDRYLVGGIGQLFTRWYRSVIYEMG